MRPYSLVLPFFLALFAAIYAPIFFPSLRFLAFAPFLGLCYMQKSYTASLWIATLCGLIIDLLSAQHRFGLYALTFALTTLILYNQKNQFFDDKPLGLSIFTAVISMLASLIQLIIVSAFGNSVSLSLELLLTDVLAISFIDAIYAFLWFTCPLKGYIYIKMRIVRFGWKGLFFKKINSDEL